MTKSILNKIDALYTRLSKGHKKIADYIMVNYDKAAFMTAARLGATVGVSESTVVRSAATLANFLAFYFRPVYDNVVLVDSARASEVFEQIFRIDKRDICIAISFPRYSNQTINALHFIHDKGATVISITDSELSPIARFADCLLIARSTMASFVDSLVAPLSLINALIVAATFDRRSEVYDNLNELEKIYDEYNIYDKQEASGEDET